MNRTCHPSARHLSDVKNGAARNYERGTLFAGSRRVSHAWICLVAVLSFVHLFGETAAWAQPVPPGGKKPPAKEQPKLPPPDELKIDSEKLPEKWQPPRERLAIMDLDMPLVTKDELDKLKKESQKYFKVRNEVDLSDAAKIIVAKSIRYRIAVMTLKDQVPNLPVLHKRFIDETAPIVNAAKRPADCAALTDTIHHEVVKQIAELLKNNFYVRLHAVLILSELDYAPAFEPLLQVIQAKDIHDDPVNGQPEAVKIPATMGLIRIMRFTNPRPNPKDRTAIAHAAVDELLRPNTHWWYQLRLIELLRYCDTVGIDAVHNNKPFVVDALSAVIKDDKRSWIIRAKACYALGRVPLPPSVSPVDVVTVVADFALQLSAAAAANPKNQSWKSCFWDVYLAFHANDNVKDKDMDAERKFPGGFLGRIKAVAQPAYSVIVPIVNDILNDKVPDAGSRQKLEAFVRARLQNPPVPGVPPNNGGPQNVNVGPNN